jgi:hypothetical protein
MVRKMTASSVKKGVKEWGLMLALFLIASVFVAIAPFTPAITVETLDATCTVIDPTMTYMVRDVVHYFVNYTNNDPTCNCTLDLWDILPDGTTLTFGDDVFFDISESHVYTFDYVVKSGDVKDPSGPITFKHIINTARASGVNGHNDIIDVAISKISRIKQIFDTDASANPYPSISGRHNGTIRSNETITVHKLYTYPCPGTGGHTEYVKIWNSTDWTVTATWNGYTGDWHNITFNNSFTLYANETYNYTIVTGSYPQIIHEASWNATGGKITCTEFVDVNGKRHEGWIPAIRLD